MKMNKSQPYEGVEEVNNDTIEQLVVPSPSFWLSQVHAEAKTSGWISSSLGAFRETAPLWLSRLAGQAYTTTMTLTRGMANTSAPAGQYWGYITRGQGGPFAGAIGSLSPDTHEGIQCLSFFTDSFGTNLVKISFSGALPRSLRVIVADSTWADLEAGRSSFTVDWPTVAQRLRDNGTLSIVVYYR